MLALGQAPWKCQPLAMALTAHECAVTWKLHHDKGRSQQRDGKWGGCAVIGDGDGKADVWHHHAAGPRWWRTYIDCLARLEQDGVQTGSVRRLSCSTRVGVWREGKPVTSPFGPPANDITRRAKSQAQRVISGKGWWPGAAAPELFQMWPG